MKLDDRRNITAKQRQRISRNIKDISDHLGYGWYEGMVELLRDFSGPWQGKHIPTSKICHKRKLGRL